MLDTNRCFMRFRDRAERIDSNEIAETFVAVGPLLDVLDSTNNQIIYGRRGTGKTHALRYFLGRRMTLGDVAVYIDCQNIGSNQSIYDDKSLPIAERATRLPDLRDELQMLVLQETRNILEGKSLDVDHLAQARSIIVAIEKFAQSDKDSKDEAANIPKDITREVRPPVDSNTQANKPLKVRTLRSGLPGKYLPIETDDLS